MKQTLKLTAIAGIGLLIAAPAFAATMLSFSPSAVNVKEGDKVNVTVKIDSQGAKVYTVKLELNFPTNLLEVTSFTFAGSGWLAVSQPGYDVTNNSTGVILKTAGYPGGLTSPASFGVISFRAKKSGTGTIKLGGNSAALNASNQNTLDGSSVQIAVTVAAKPVAAKIPVPKTAEKDTTTSEPTPIVEETSTAAVTPELSSPPSLLAAIVNTLSLGTGNAIVGVIVVLVVLVILGYLIYRGRRSKAGP